MHFPLHLLPILLALIPTLRAECCGAGECVSWTIIPGPPGKPDKELCNRWKCADGFHHGAFQCCGVSKCNVFCCNCDKRGTKGIASNTRLTDLLIASAVCRVPRALASPQLVLGLDTVALSDEDMFKAANTAGTGNLSVDEFATYMGADFGDVGLVAKFAV